MAHTSAVCATILNVNRTSDCAPVRLDFMVPKDFNEPENLDGDGYAPDVITNEAEKKRVWRQLFSGKVTYE